MHAAFAVEVKWPWKNRNIFCFCNKCCVCVLVCTRTKEEIMGKDWNSNTLLQHPFVICESLYIKKIRINLKKDLFELVTSKQKLNITKYHRGLSKVMANLRHINPRIFGVIYAFLVTVVKYLQLLFSEAAWRFNAILCVLQAIANLLRQTLYFRSFRTFPWSICIYPSPPPPLSMLLWNNNTERGRGVRNVFQFFHLLSRVYF